MAVIMKFALIASLSASLTVAQGVGTPDVRPKLVTQKCTKAAGCKVRNTSLVLEAQFHRIHAKDSSAQCLIPTEPGSGTLNTTICSDAATCAQNCVFDAVDYAATGVTTTNDAMVLKAYTQQSGKLTFTGPRVYLLNEDNQQYEMMQMLNQELSFDVDLSKLVCGMNGALYFSEMEAAGGQGPMNPAGAAAGTGYCDAQCPALPFINGVANVQQKGACCAEMDLWEANSRSTAYTPHTCSEAGVFQCTGDQCGSQGVCDKNGCGYNTYALGNKQFYGLNGTVDTNKPFTVVTQFITDTGDATGKLKEIRRLYVQQGKIIPNASNKMVSGTAQGNSITEDLCKTSAQTFEKLGGLTGMGQALGRGMVLIFSIWNDKSQFMNWLDSGSAGPCSATEGDPKLIQANHPDVTVTFSNIKWGDLNTTFSSAAM